MIKFEFSPSAPLLDSYNLKIVTPTQRQMIAYTQTLPAAHRDEFQQFFTPAKVADLLTCRPEDLLGHIDDVYDRFPLIADRYWPARLLNGVPIPDDIHAYEIRSAESKAVIDLICAEAIEFLLPIAAPEMTHMTSLLTQLQGANTAAKKRAALKIIKKTEQGNTLATENHKEIFPDWVNSFESVFNYSALSANIGHDIVDEWKIYVCLYCNDEPIQTKGKRTKIRTDLDHFYPRTKFPFLAVTLSNLIPSGKTCNQSYKKNKDMTEHEHPFVRGVGQHRVFHLMTSIGEVVTEDNFSVSIMEQGGKLDLNLSEFEIAHNYGISDEIKSWVVDAFGAVEMIVGYNDPVVKAKLLSGLIKTDKPAHRERHKKFKADSINQFAEKEIVSFP
ncbi:hypothetical protein LJR277_004114 [Pseudomonas sp. LjRoot277]|uniref:hypothetical protein n=1 Tax=Pseudomonas sp. LjRoot277 TaxID=3342307 RepID=UPI003ECFA52F